MNPSSHIPPRIGLTGGMGSGKSYIAREFEKLGAKVLDADQVARALRAPGGTASAAILSRFGTLDPKQLRTILSSDPKAKAALESILHPLIQVESNRIMQEMSESRPTPKLILYEASLLVESGRHVDFQGVILVQCPPDERRKRVMKRDQCSEADAQRMIEAQMSDHERALALQGKVTTWIIDNSTLTLPDEQAVRHRVMKLLEQIAPTC